MTRRPEPSMQTKRLLWAESMRHCMNPTCESDLFANGSFTGDMAHIVEHRDGGDVSFENMLVLCKICHKEVDDQRSEATVPMLLSWKHKRAAEIRTRFTKVYDTFDQLSTDVVPILRSNLVIFQSYGPGDTLAAYDQKHKMWLQFEGQLIANNQKLALLLEANRHLIHKSYRAIIDEFQLHIGEFIHTRKTRRIQRVNLFPTELNSIFGVEQAHFKLAANVSALQNLITRLVQGGKFISLELVERQVLTYTHQGKTVELDLHDEPRALQTYWNEHCYRRQTTDVRLDNLVFAFQWLKNRNCRVEFREVSNLVDVAVLHPIHGRAEVVFCYKYLCSLTDIYAVPEREGLIVVNLHNWNDGPFTDEAVEHATQIGVRTMNQREFFAFIGRGFQ